MDVGVVDEACTRELRRSVLRPHLPPDAPLPGDDVTGAVHLAARDDGAVISTCFLYPDPCPWLPDRAAAWHLRQMATAPGQRRQGAGGAVVEAAASYARTAGGEVLWCYAREHAAAFYARHRFLRDRGRFTDELRTTPHQRMWRELTGAATSSTG